MYTRNINPFISLRAMVFEDADNWYADDGKLTKTFCEQTEKDLKHDNDDCCACDEAKYSVRINFPDIYLQYNLIGFR